MARRMPAGRQAEITQVAAALFDEKGFHASSMEDVAEAMGIKKPTLYHYVQSKAEIVSWIHDECVAAVLPPLKGYVSSGMPSTEALFHVAQDIFGLLDQKPGYLRVYFENHRDLDRRNQSRITTMRDEYYGLVKQVLEEGAVRGELVVEDSSLSALAFFGMCNWGYQWYEPGGPRSARDVATYVWRTFVGGVRSPDAEPLEVPVEQSAS